MLGHTNPREQIGYITVGLLAHCVLDDNTECAGIVQDSLCTLIDPTYTGQTEFPDLAFQRLQEYDLLSQVLSEQGLTVAELLGLFVAGKAKPFFRALAKQAILDAEYRDDRTPRSIRVSLRQASKSTNREMP